MRSSDTIHLRIARSLRASVYSALILVLISVILKFLGLNQAFFIAAAGIGLILIGPMAGLVTVAAIALAKKNLKHFYAALFILSIFITAFLVGM